MNKKTNLSANAAQARNKKSVKEFRSLIETMPVMLYLAEPFPPYSPIYVSRAFEMFGYPLEEWRESSDLWMRAIHPDDRERILQETKTALKSGGETDYEYRLVARNGDVYWVHDRGYFARDGQGNPICWQGVILNVTDRVKSEKRLRTSEKRYRQMFEKNNSVKLLIDADTRAIVEANPAACDFYGYAAEEFKLKNLADLNCLSPAKIKREMNRAIKEKSNYFIFKHRLASGEIRDVEVHSSRFFDEDRNLLYSVVYDITERQFAERELEKREELYRTLARHIPKTAVLIFDKNFRYTLAEGEQLAQHDFSKEMFEGKTLYEVFPPEICEEWADYYNRALAGEHIGFEREEPDGCFQTYVVPVKNERGEIYAGMVMWQDITERVKSEKALKESEEQYRNLFENANDLIYVHDFDGKFISVNQAAERLFGYSHEESLEMNLKDIIAPDYLEVAFQRIAAKIQGEKQSSYVIECVTKSGSRITVEVNSRVIYKDGKPVAVQGIARDITARRRAEAALVESERRYRLLGEGIKHQVWTAQVDGKLDYVNNRMLKYFGRTSEEMIGIGWRDFVHPDDLPMCLKKWEYSLKSLKDYEVELRLKRFDGTYLWHKARATAGVDAEGNTISWFGTNSDINDKKIAEAKLNHFAGHDPLTNLPNRAKFMNHLERAANRAQCNPAYQFAVLFLDLDRFKLINDSLGHSIGDKLLISIAERLEACVRPGDIVARLGGDEFTVLLGNISEPADAVHIADRFLENLSAPFKLDGYEVFTSASIGIIVSDAIHRQPEDFLRDADTAMYRAKESGKARYEIFDREMHIRNMKLLEMENDLRRAIDNNEFHVFYQPLVSLETGKIREFEALIRWQHPKHGLIMPNDFIPVAEETGLIIPIGEWILNEACRQTVEWKKKFPDCADLSVSVNLSAKQLLHPNLTAHVAKVLTQTGLNSRYLKLEVTESMVMENSDKALAVLTDLKNSGISISTDDFGTGYSSLSYLHLFPFNCIKIDRSFVSKMDADRKSEAIVRTILLLGQNLLLEVIAEGIETETQLNALRLLGCQTGQGFLFSKPVDAATAATLLQNGFSKIVEPVSFDFSQMGDQLLEVDKIQ